MDGSRVLWEPELSMVNWRSRSCILTRPRDTQHTHMEEVLILASLHDLALHSRDNVSLETLRVPLAIRVAVWEPLSYGFVSEHRWAANIIIGKMYLSFLINLIHTSVTAMTITMSSYSAYSKEISNE